MGQCQSSELLRNCRAIYVHMLPTSCTLWLRARSADQRAGLFPLAPSDDAVI